MAAEDKHAALLLALAGPKGSASGDAATSDGDDMEATAAQDIMDAVKERDVGALQGALKRFVSSCMSSYDKDEDAGSES